MKRKEIIDIFNYLDKIKMSQLKDKDVRSRLMHIYVGLRDAALKVEAENRTITEQLLKGMEDRREEKDALLRRLQRAPRDEQEGIKSIIFNEFYDVLMAEDDCLHEIEKSLKYDMDVEVEKIDSIAFVNALDDANIEYTGRTLATLAPILDFTDLKELHHAKSEE